MCLLLIYINLIIYLPTVEKKRKCMSGILKNGLRLAILYDNYVQLGVANAAVIQNCNSKKCSGQFSMKTCES